MEHDCINEECYFDPFMDLRYKVLIFVPALAGLVIGFFSIRFLSLVQLIVLILSGFYASFNIMISGSRDIRTDSTMHLLMKRSVLENPDLTGEFSNLEEHLKEILLGVDNEDGKWLGKELFLFPFPK